MTRHRQPAATGTPLGPTGGHAMTERKKYQRNTSFDELGWTEYASGAKGTLFLVGEEGDETAPVVTYAHFPPGAVVEAHSHPCDYAEIIVAGTQQVTRRWHKAGDIRIVKAGTVYGPLVAGPEGCTVMVIFRNGDWQSKFVTRSSTTTATS